MMVHGEYSLMQKGTVGYRKELAELLQYIVNSNSNNAVNDTTNQLHQVVEHVRQRPDLGVKYMKSWEREWFA
jgi:hypothetical protein